MAALALFRKIRTFGATPFGVKWLFAEAVMTSAYVKATLLFLPFRKVVRWLGKPQETRPDYDNNGHADLVTYVKSAMNMCDKYTPWRTECYTRALTAKIMLGRRNIPSTLFLGFCKEESGRLKGHAWLQSSGKIVTGFCDFSKYEIHSAFS